RHLIRIVGFVVALKVQRRSAAAVASVQLCWRAQRRSLRCLKEALAQSLPAAALALILNVDLDGRAYPEEVNTFYANVLLAPAFFKPIPGGLSDWLRLRGCGRRPFLVLIELLWCISLVFASEARTRGSFFAAFVAVALCCGAA
ncbi:unnamed protein product, partial [Effrenium voratum]